MNRKLIIALIIIILIILGGLVVFSHGSAKSDTQINFLTGKTLKNGDQIQFELRDAQGNTLANQQLTITFGANGQTQTYSVVTDAQGKGALALNNGENGNYSITVKYNGDDKYNGCSASQTVTIGEVTSDTDNTYTSSESTSSQNTNASASSAASQSNTDLNYDSELNVYYDSEGKIVGGQNDGANYEDVKNNPPQVDEEGNLVWLINYLINPFF